MTYHCDYCRVDISNALHIKCAVCKDFDLCLQCFAAGHAVQPHQPTHAYRLIHHVTTPIFTPDWGADEELLLLEAIEVYGLGNWAEAANYVGSKSRQQCEQHYMACYLESRTAPLPDCSEPLPTAGAIEAASNAAAAAANAAAATAEAAEFLAAAAQRPDASAATEAAAAAAALLAAAPPPPPPLSILHGHGRGPTGRITKASVPATPSSSSSSSSSSASAASANAGHGPVTTPGPASAGLGSGSAAAAAAGSAAATAAAASAALGGATAAERERELVRAAEEATWRVQQQLFRSKQKNSLAGLVGYMPQRGDFET